MILTLSFNYFLSKVYFHKKWTAKTKGKYIVCFQVCGPNEAYQKDKTSSVWRHLQNTAEQESRPQIPTWHETQVGVSSERRGPLRHVEDAEAGAQPV